MCRMSAQYEEEVAMTTEKKTGLAEGTTQVRIEYCIP